MAKGKFHEWITPEGLLKIEGWAKDGLTDEQIAINMGIKRQTIYEWKNRFPDITYALKQGKEVIDRQVENALLRRALGYEYEETTKELTENNELGVTKIVTKTQAPDVTAQIFWLKNRKPAEWRDKRETEHSGTITNKNIDAGQDLSKLSDEELKVLEEILEKSTDAATD